ncbi:hypothetical protein D8I35_04075 [Corticibacter populi]|uniref:Lipoprotein n=2 Tax=Corticibacter populi TaxID=1550736 RepID=A0A3M6QZ47_9BURK|nr:hypothetical protein D8I35_04075 [Corticibacter populi]
MEQASASTRNALLLGCVAAVATMLAACASTAGNAPEVSIEERLQKQHLQIGESIQRIPSFGISGWSYLDKRHVLIDNGPGKQYLIRTDIDCDELAFANHLGYTSTAGALTRFDRLKSRSASGWPIDCNIEAIHQLDKLPALQ